MSDLLVPLYHLSAAACEQKIADLRANENVIIRRAHPFELSRVRRFVLRHFSEGWADEAEAAFARFPVTCFIAVHEKRVVGFACMESTARAFFGPTGVNETYRNKGIGGALLLQSLLALRDMGYAYGIIGWAGPVAFYEKAVGAIVIPDSFPGIFRDMLGPDGEETNKT